MTSVRSVAEPSRRVLRHEVHAVHATTGEPVAVRAAFDGPAPPGYLLTTLYGLVVVTADATFAPPAAPVRLSLTATERALHLASPGTLIVLDQAVITHSFAPVPSQLEIVLFTEAGPRTGRRVTARPTAGDAVPLPELAGTPGSYRSAPISWGAGFHPFEIRVDGLPLRRAFLDLDRRVTRIRLFDSSWPGVRT
jgi:hypothetical protein